MFAVLSLGLGMQMLNQLLFELLATPVLVPFVQTDKDKRYIHEYGNSLECFMVGSGMMCEAVL